VIGSWFKVERGLLLLRDVEENGHLVPPPRSYRSSSLLELARCVQNDELVGTSKPTPSEASYDARSGFGC
jgi:hypothetical protein